MPRPLGNGTLYPMSSGWGLRYRDENGRRRQHFVARTKVEALAVQAKLIDERNRRMRGERMAPRELGLASIKEAWLADLATRSRPAYLRRRTREIDEALDAMRATKLVHLRTDRVLAYRAELLAAGASHRTANYRVASVTAMLAWAASLDLIGENPLDGLRPLPLRGHERRERRALSDHEAAAILAAAESEDASWLFPQVPLLRTLLETGARPSELARLRWAQLDLRAASLTILPRTTKTRAGERTLPLPASLVELLRAMRVQHARRLERIPGPDEAVFRAPKGAEVRVDGFRILFHRWRKAARVPVQTPAGSCDVYSLRHTFATRQARAGTVLQHLQYLMGHEDPKTTVQFYTHLAVEDVRYATREPELAQEAVAGARDESTTKRQGGPQSGPPAEPQPVAPEPVAPGPEAPRVRQAVAGIAEPEPSRARETARKEARRAILGLAVVADCASSGQHYDDITTTPGADIRLLEIEPGVYWLQSRTEGVVARGPRAWCLAEARRRAAVRGSWAVSDGALEAVQDGPGSLPAELRGGAREVAS